MLINNFHEFTDAVFKAVWRGMVAQGFQLARTSRYSGPDSHHEHWIRMPSAEHGYLADPLGWLIPNDKLPSITRARPEGNAQNKAWDAGRYVSMTADEAISEDLLAEPFATFLKHHRGHLGEAVSLINTIANLHDTASAPDRFRHDLRALALRYSVELPSVEDTKAWLERNKER